MEKLAEFDARIARSVGASGNLTPLPANPSDGLVLVVDDERMIRILVSEILKDIKIRSAEAADGMEAISFIAATRPDAILLDVMLPGIDGFEICRRIKNHPDTVNIPVFMISGLRHPDMIYRALAAGADGFINKPFDYREVALRVRTALRTHGISKNINSVSVPKDLETVVPERVNRSLQNVVETLSKLSRFEGLPSELRREAEIAAAAANRIVSMTEGVREIEALKKDLGSLGKAPEVLGSIFDEALAAFGDEVKFYKTVAPDLRVICQRQIVVKALVKLIGFAKDQFGGGTGRLSITALEDGGKILVRVTSLGDASDRIGFGEKDSRGMTAEAKEVMEVDAEIENRLFLAFCVAAFGAQGGEVGGSGNSLFFTLASAASSPRLG